MARKKVPAAAQTKVVKAENVEIVEDVVDEKLVKKSIAWIKDAVANTLLKGALDVGNYVLDNFFDGDIEQVQSKSRKKSASFSKLTEYCGTNDLPVSKTWLHNAVGLAITDRALPKSAASYRKLSASHRVALLPLDDTSKVAKFADRAFKKEMSVRDLKEVVSEELAKEDRDPRGRKPKPLIVKTLDRSIKLFTMDSGRKSFRKSDVDELSDDDAKNALKAATELIKSLQGLVEKLEGR